MKKLFTTLTTLMLMMTALVTNAQTSTSKHEPFSLSKKDHDCSFSVSGGENPNNNLSDMIIHPGNTINMSCSYVGKSSCKVFCMVYHNNKEVKQAEGKSASLSYTIPADMTGEIKTKFCYQYENDYLPHSLGYQCRWNIVKESNKPEKAPEPEPEKEPKIEHRPGISCVKDTKIRFNDLYGEVSYRCEFKGDYSYEYATIDAILYEDTRIKTEEESGAILGLEDMSTYVIKPESILLIHTEEDGVSKIEFIAGALWGNVKKMMEGKTLDCEMSECVAGIKGTIFALEESSQGSKVWVFAGIVEVTNKKTGKKTTLNAGQNITVKGKNNNVQSFNIEDGAKQFGIPMDHITNHYTNKKLSKISLESICKPNKGTAPKKEGNKDSGKNTTSGKKLSINKKSNTDKDTNAGKKLNIGKKSSTDKDTNADKDTKAGKKPTINKKNNTDKNATTPKGQYARYGAKCGIVKRVDEGDDIRMYYTTWWDDYGRLERSEITRCEEKVGGKWKSTSAPQIKNIIVDDKHYMYSKSTGWKQLKNDEINFLGSGSKTVNGCKLEKNGTATVNGKPCDIFKGKRNGTTIEYYIWEGVPMKRVEKDSEGTTTTTVESIELPASVDASLFEIPKVKQ